MKLSRNLAETALAAALTLVILNQFRLSRKVDELVSGQKEPASGQTELAPPTNVHGSVQEALIQLEQSRQDLAAAEYRFTNAMAKVEDLDRSLAATAANLDRIKQETSLAISNLAARVAPGMPLLGRGWGPEQAVGAPDTHRAGDLQTAWASREPDAGEEWLKLDYERALELAEVRVRETHNPGAISKIAAVLPNGQEMILWEGQEPPAEAPVDMTFPVSGQVVAQSVKVYLDTRRVPGWNEIDAVEMIGRDGSHQWASQATASSTYAEPLPTGLGPRSNAIEQSQ